MHGQQNVKCKKCKVISNFLDSVKVFMKICEERYYVNRILLGMGAETFRFTFLLASLTER